MVLNSFTVWHGHKLETTLLQVVFQEAFAILVSHLLDLPFRVYMKICFLIRLCIVNKTCSFIKFSVDRALDNSEWNQKSIHDLAMDPFRYLLKSVAVQIRSRELT
jgi:hypothetical protein